MYGPMVWAAAVANSVITLWTTILGVGAGGVVEGYEDKYYYGRRANGIYIPRYRNLFGDKRDYLEALVTRVVQAGQDGAVKLQK